MAEAMLRHVLQLQCNAQAITVMQELGKIKKKKIKHFLVIHLICVKQSCKKLLLQMGRNCLKFNVLSHVSLFFGAHVDGV